MAAYVSLEGAKKTQEGVVASEYFLVDDIRIPMDLVVRLVNFCERKLLLLLLGCDDNVRH